jgi:hypothetical protein
MALPVDRDNASFAANDQQLITCAGMDFAGIPTGEVARHFGVQITTIRNWRQKELYKETIEHLREDLTAKMLAMVSTPELKKKVGLALNIGVHRIIEILSNPKTRNMDLINAAKLAAQLDGRLLKFGDEEPANVPHGGNALSSELIAAMQSIKRDKEKESIQ